MIRNYADLTSKEMEDVDKDKTIILIPLGSVEQHGPQAPLGTDMMIAQVMPQYIKEEILKQTTDIEMLMFPALPIGLSIEHADFSGTATLNPDTYYHVLKDIITSIHSHGFRRFAMLLCHGGNRSTVDILSRELRQKLGVYIFALNSGAFLDAEVQATISADNTWDFHGGEMETSMALAIKPETVKLEYAQTGYKKGGYVGKKHINFSNETALNWLGHDLQTEDGTPIGIGGNPKGATADKGELILRKSAQKLVPAILEIRDWTLE